MFRNSLAFLLTIVCFLSYSCHQEDRETKIEVPLNSTWEFRKIESNKWYPAHVPGSLASDIGQINIKEKNFIFDVSKIHKVSWEYRTNFDVDHNILGHDVVQLCFKGIAANADVYLNDSLLLKVNNRLRPWTVNCKSRLKAKGNKLKVVFHHHSGRKAWHIDHHNKSDSCSGDQMSFNGNSDLLASSIGIWRPIYIQAWSVAKIDDLNLRPDSVSQKKAVYTVQLSIPSVVNQEVNLEILINNKPEGKPLPLALKKGDNVVQTKISIEKPKLWWTNGLGNPNLYNIMVRIKKGRSIIQEKHQRLGIRTIELVDHLNSAVPSCYFKLNGIPIFIKGAGFSTGNRLEYDTAKNFYSKAIENASVANFNTLWVSDKEIYDDDFYDLCDEHGILVWQDLQVNSLLVHKDSNYRENIKQEAVETIKRIRKHPCLALWWVKDTELNLYSCKNKGLAKSMTGEQPSYSKMNEEFLNGLLKEYGFSTPCLSDGVGNKSKNIVGVELLNGQMIGNIVVNYSVPSYGPLKTINNGKALLSSLDENNITTDYIHKNFNEPKSVESRIFITWIAQSEMMKSVIENHRINLPRCMGSLFGQMNDSKSGWSVSTIDSSGLWKPAQYAVKDAFSHVLVVPVREKNKVNIYAVSDAFKNLDAILLVRLIDFKGNDLYVRQIPVEIEANASGVLMSLKETEILKNVDKSKCCLVVQLNQATKTMSQNILYFTELKNLQLPKPSIDMDINEVAKGYNLILKSSVLVKNVFIQTFSRECWFSDNNFDLLPGRRAKIHIRYSGTKDELLKDIRIHSLADLK